MLFELSSIDDRARSSAFLLPVLDHLHLISHYLSSSFNQIYTVWQVLNEIAGLLKCAMFSLRRIIFRPRRSDNPLAKFFHADLELQRIADDLDSFDGSKEPNR
eukprot:sb/3478280/